MKKLFAIAAGLGLLASAPVLADGHVSGPTVYGGVSASLSVAKSVKDSAGEDDKDDSGHFLNDETSKIGVKGSSKISDDLMGVYKAELRLKADSTLDTTLRDTYVGLQGGFGQVLVGRKYGFASGALHRSAVTDTGIEDATFPGGAAPFDTFDSRFSNALTYISPDIAGLTIGVNLYPDEGLAIEKNPDNVTQTQAKESSIMDNYQAGVTYDHKEIGIGVAVGLHKDGNNSVLDTGATTTGAIKVVDRTANYLSIAYSGMKMFKVGVATISWENGSGDKGTKMTSTSLFGDYYMGDIGLGFSMAQAKTDADKEVKVALLALGVTYKLNDKMKFFADYTSNKASGGDRDTATAGDQEYKDERTELKVGFKSSF